MSGLPENAPVAIVSGGSIDVAFALVFARAGLLVRVWDPDAARRAAITGEVRARLLDLDGYGLLGEPVDTILVRVAVLNELGPAAKDAQHAQECAPERVELKRELFAELDRLARPRPCWPVLPPFFRPPPSRQVCRGVHATWLPIPAIRLT
jgi:3-hydroxyacyl-CoA dehydrogenase